VRDGEYCRSLPVGVRHLADGVAVPAPAAEALRVRRFLLLQGCQELVYPYWHERTDRDTGEIKQRSEFRVSVCCREPVSDGVRVYRNGPAVGYGGVMRCGSVWGCVVCCAKVMRRRGEQISALFDAVHVRGGTAVMVTFTAGHDVADKLANLLDAFKAAQRSMSQSKRYRNLVAGREGSVTVTEITYGRNGWHPHQHQAWFFADGFAPEPEQLASALFPLWRAACEGVGLHTIERIGSHRVGVDVVRAWDASEYLAKFDRERDWSLSSEMTSGRLKTAEGGGITPWGILEDAIIRGKDSPAAALWIEYLRATKGKACISLKGAAKLCKHVGIPVAIDDFADANDVGQGEVIGTLSASAFDTVVRAGGLGRLLEAARRGGLSELDRELQIIQ
jgi:hypothetical protein